MAKITSDDLEELEKRSGVKRIRVKGNAPKKSKKSRPHDAEIEKARKLIKVLDGYTLNILSQNQQLRGTAGLPDCFLFTPDGAVWWECKASKSDTLRPAQKAFRDACHERDIPHVAGGFDDLLDFLEIEHK